MDGRIPNIVFKLAASNICAIQNNKNAKTNRKIDRMGTDLSFVLLDDIVSTRMRNLGLRIKV